VQVAALYCPSCGATFDVAAVDDDDLISLTCQHCSAFLSELSVGDSFVAPEFEPQPGEPTITQTSGPRDAYD
jgi:hypothetical protein